MNNERIQEIKKKIERGMKLYESGLLPKQFEQNVLDDAYLLSEVERLQEENKVMKEALEWYGDKKNYEQELCYFDEEKTDPYYEVPEALNDEGTYARKVLSQLKGE
ncbi:hypothetical protein D3C76_1391830 [compost metagenome]